VQIREELLPQPGAVIGGQYRVDSLIGMGGMGAVFAGTHLRTGRAVAVKWMLPQAAASKEALQRFIAEAQATARIEHPNVVHIYDYGEDGGAPFLVMERLRGESLRARLERVGRLSAVDAVRLLLPAMRGVAEAHREGIVHRDIKPDNIFLCVGKDGAEREAKVVDFGISKLRDGNGPSNLTGTGMMMGTPAYMSPEQLNAPREADRGFDVYAFGVVLYETICGRCPYEAEGLYQLVARIMSAEAIPPSQLAADVTPALEAVILRAMHRDAAQRYPDVPTLMDALQAAASTLAPATAVAPTLGMPAPRPMTPVTPMPTAVMGAHSPFPATAVHATPSSSPPLAKTVSAYPPAPTPHVAFAAPPKRSPLKLVLAALVALALGVGVTAGALYVVTGKRDREAPTISGAPTSTTAAPSAAATPTPTTAPSAPSAPTAVDPPSAPPAPQATAPSTDTPPTEARPTEAPPSEPRPRASRPRTPSAPPPSMPIAQPVPAPIVQPVAPVLPRPTPPPSTGRGTNGAMIIE
jgi:serine/threonine-protein kinase